MKIVLFTASVCNQILMRIRSLTVIFMTKGVLFFLVGKLEFNYRTYIQYTTVPYMFC